mgnify:CR=1 FL=1
MIAMDLGIGDVRRAARSIAEERMQDQCQVTRRASEGARDPETGKVTYPDPTVLYGPDVEPHRGKCRVRMPYANAAVMVDAGATLVMQQTHLSLPWDVVLERGDVVEILDSDNPLLVGKTFTIRPLPTGSQQSANRYGIEAVH